MACSSTHKLIIRRKNGVVTSREWVRLEDGLLETDPAVLARLEIEVDDDTASCDVSDELLQSILDKLGEDCTGDPINVFVCNQVDLSTIEASLATAITELQAINANTDTLEASLATLITEIQTGNATLSTINSTINSSLTELQAINANTDTVEATLEATQTLLQTEFDQTQVLLQALLDKLSEDCTGAPINVNVCNQIDLGNLETLLTQAVTALQAIDANTDGIEAQLTQVIGDIQAGNATLTAINACCAASLTELQAINANTDNVESILTSTQTLLQTEFDETQVLLQALLDKLSEPCAGAPINVNVCNQIDLGNLETLLTQAVTALQAIDANTDGIEAQLTQVIGDIQAGNATLTSINACCQSSLTELQAINANTDSIEAILTSTQTLLQSEFDETQVLLQALLDKLNEPCTGAPLNVNVCNQIDLGNLETLLTQAVTALQAIDANTDGIEAQLTQVIGDIQAGNATLTAINACCAASLIELQAINANTDNVESILTSTQTLLQTEFDETQVLLQSILDKLNAPCGSGQNVEVCPIVISVSEVIVCADDEPAIRKVTLSSDGTEVVEFLSIDGAVITPTTWTPGECAEATEITSVSCDIPLDVSCILPPTFTINSELSDNGTVATYSVTRDTDSVNFVVQLTEVSGDTTMSISGGDIRVRLDNAPGAEVLWEWFEADGITPVGADFTAGFEVGDLDGPASNEAMTLTNADYCGIANNGSTDIIVGPTETTVFGTGGGTASANLQAAFSSQSTTILYSADSGGRNFNHNFSNAVSVTNFTLDASQFTATSSATANPTELTYTVDSSTNGTFNVTTFTQQDVNDGLVEFDVNPAVTIGSVIDYQITVTDIDGNSDVCVFSTTL